MHSFNFVVFPSCVKPCEYPRVDACESRSGRIQAYFTKERGLKPTEISGILGFIPADFG